jgi:hypothetical protein
MPTSEGDSDSAATLASVIRLVADRASNRRSHHRRVCVFLGAGADVGAGGLSFSQLKRQAIEEFARRPIFDITDEGLIDAQFDNLFAKLPPDERALLVETLFRRLRPLRPSDAYKLLVLLAEAGAIDAVVTTNFDSMLEAAQQELGRDIFQVFAPGVARPYLVADGGFSAPRAPYLKLHGDLSSRAVTLLTVTDLESGSYDASMLQLLENILSSHDLIITGYSGNDNVLAHLIAKFVLDATTRVFWCTPGELSRASPLAQLLENRFRQIRSTFDDLISGLARPVLERPSTAIPQPTYIRCLFDWRIEYGNREYLDAYASRGGASIADLFARRNSIEAQLGQFMQGPRRLAVIAGPSGYGKTTIGVRLHRIWNGHRSTKVLLVRSRTLPADGDIEQLISEQLGGLGSRAPFSIFQLERWAADNDLRIVIFIDGLNEFSPDIDRCVQLLRSILRYCYFLPEAESALRIIVTIRQETWRAILPHIDAMLLRTVLWTPDAADQAPHTISCDKFTDDELQDAIARVGNAEYAAIDLDALSSDTAEIVHDPYAFGLVADTVHRGGFADANLYRTLYESRLTQCGTYIDQATILDSLCTVALGCLASGEDRFREVDIRPAALRGEIVRSMKDLRILVDGTEGFLRFDHDRTLEYFLAVGLASSAKPSLETLPDLLQFLKDFSTQARAVAAARMHYQLAPARFSCVTQALRLLDANGSFGRSDAETLFGFARDVLFEMAEQDESVAYRYLEDAVHSAMSGRIGEHQERAVVQCVAGLTELKAIPLLITASHSASSVARAEAAVYATDRLVRRFLTDAQRETPIDLGHEPYASFLAEPDEPGWHRLGRLLGFVSELGPDNTQANEYAEVTRSAHELLDSILSEPTWDQASANAIGEYLLASLDRLLFNATMQGVENFFSNSGRRAFAVLVKRLGDGAVISNDDWRAVARYTQSLEYDVEYHLCHVLLLISALNDLDVTMQFAEARLSELTSRSSPVEIDFWHSALVYFHVACAVPYNEARFAKYEERILRDWPQTLLFRPGLGRGKRRGFDDPFDRNFEDGFAVIFPYGMLMPGLRRRKHPYKAYRREIDAYSGSPLPLYSHYLDVFIRSGRIEEAVQLLQALAMVIISWPMEGLLAMRAAIGLDDPRLRRAVLRTLAEAYGRHPKETAYFLRTSGVALSDEDVLEIKIRRDARLGRRQIAEEQWARIAHFLLGRKGAKTALIAAVEAIIGAHSPHDAVQRVLRELGLLAT